MKAEIEGEGLNIRLKLIPETFLDAQRLGILVGTNKIEGCTEQFTLGPKPQTFDHISFRIIDLCNALRCMEETPD